MHNKVSLIGRLGKDPAIKVFNPNSSVAEFPLATTETYKDKDGKWVELTDWHNIKIPNKFMAERAEKYLHKGSFIFLEGKLRTRSYDKDGEKKYITEVVVDKFLMLDKKEEGAATSNNHSNTSSRNEENHSNEIPKDDLPF